MMVEVGPDVGFIGRGVVSDLLSGLSVWRMEVSSWRGIWFYNISTNNFVLK